MLHETLKNSRIILASASPRRQQLLKKLGLTFDVRVPHVEESFPAHLKKEEIAVYLSRLKADAIPANDLTGNTLLIAADTIVWLDHELLPKPHDSKAAIDMLTKLSGKSHDVITGVTLKSPAEAHSFYSLTRVWFRDLTREEIQYYVHVFKPFDKAGGYGIQEWIGYTGIEKIEGSYYNVVGLPVEKLYSEIQDFIA